MCSWVTIRWKLTLSVAILIHSSKFEYICSGVKVATTGIWIGTGSAVARAFKAEALPLFVISNCCRSRTSLVNRSLWSAAVDFSLPLLRCESWLLERSGGRVITTLLLLLLQTEYAEEKGGARWKIEKWDSRRTGGFSRDAEFCKLYNENHAAKLIKRLYVALRCRKIVSR